MSAYDAFAPYYAQWSQHMTEDVPFYVSLARESDGPLVELAVGTGRAAAAAAAASVELDLRLGDMRDLELDEPAGLVYCPFRSLLHLPTWHDRRRVFERVAASLRPGGRFAWNAFCFHHRLATEHEGRNEEPTPHTVVHAPGDSRIDVVQDAGPVISLWWATKNEWLGLIDVAGLEVEALYGDFERGAFHDDSTEFVWVTRRP